MHGFAKRFLASQAVQHWLQKSDAWFPWITHLLGRRKGQTMCQTCPDHGPDMSDHGQTHHAWVSPWSVTTACVILVMEASGVVAGRHAQFDTSIACGKYCCKETAAKFAHNRDPVWPIRYKHKRLQVMLYTRISMLLLGVAGDVAEPSVFHPNHHIPSGLPFAWSSATYESIPHTTPLGPSGT